MLFAFGEGAWNAVSLREMRVE